MEGMRRFSRRTFVAWVGGASAGFYLFGRVPGTSVPVASPRSRRHPGPDRHREVPDCHARPAGHAEGRDDRPAWRKERRLLRDLDGQFQRSCPLGCPRRPYGDTGRSAREQPRVPPHALTLRSRRGNRPVQVKWINDLKGGGGAFLPHLLPVDPTLHWANPPGGTTGRDMRPEFEETPARTRAPSRYSRPRRGRGR